MSYTQGLETSSDFALVREAISKRWNIPEATRQRCIALLQQVVQSPYNPDSPKEVKNQIEAVRTIVSMDRLNLSEEQMLMPIMHIHDHAHTVRLENLADDELENEIQRLREANLLSDLMQSESHDVLFIDSHYDLYAI